MNDFFKNFNNYIRDAQIDSFSFWAFPICTLIFIWFFTTVGLKVFTKRKKLKTVFIVNRAWIISSLIAAGILISLICFWWSKNYFAQNSYQLSLLISLTFAMFIPILSLLSLRSFYTQDGIKEITDQPKTQNQLNTTIPFVKQVFRKNKLYFIIPLFGFLFLFLFLYKGTNLIAIVYDNSESMQQTNAIDALSETFSTLQANNEIILTTIEGYQENDKPPVLKTNMKEIMAVSKSSNLKAGNVVAFANPIDAKNGLTQVSNQCYGSPICESIWKTFLYITETKANQTFANKLLIIITDGEDNLMGESIATGKFFSTDEKFADYFPPEKVFVIDYSNKELNPFMQLSENAGYDIYPAENNKQAYLDALDNALQSFKNNWFLIYWTITIVIIFTVIGLLIQPKEIV